MKFHSNSELPSPVRALFTWNRKDNSQGFRLWRDEPKMKTLALFRPRCGTPVPRAAGLYCC